jgi:hypothetical protein
MNSCKIRRIPSLFLLLLPHVSFLTPALNPYCTVSSKEHFMMACGENDKCCVKSAKKSTKLQK